MERGSDQYKIMGNYEGEPQSLQEQGKQDSAKYGTIVIIKTIMSFTFIMILSQFFYGEDADG